MKLVLIKELYYDARPTKSQEMLFGFVNVILLHSYHLHVLATLGQGG
jgi:hypothetical protein